jgi:hypothetical protein
VSLFYKHEKYKHAYTFARVAQLSGYEDVDILPIEHQLAAAGKSLDSLDDLAQKTYDSIQEGSFVSPRGF